MAARLQSYKFGFNYIWKNNIFSFFVSDPVFLN